jgi:hypothetical protein
MKTQFYWHAYHDTLLSGFIDDYAYKSRLRQIQIDKAQWETKADIKLRLRLFQPVKGKLPQRYVDFYEGKTRSYLGVPARTWNAVYRLHEEECKNCPWVGFDDRPEVGNIFADRGPYVEHAFKLPKTGKAVEA